jgi:hypothetical protein
MTAIAIMWQSSATDTIDITTMAIATRNNINYQRQIIQKNFLEKDPTLWENNLTEIDKSITEESNANSDDDEDYWTIGARIRSNLAKPTNEITNNDNYNDDGESFGSHVSDKIGEIRAHAKHEGKSARNEHKNASRVA